MLVQDKLEHQQMRSVARTSMNRVFIYVVWQVRHSSQDVFYYPGSTHSSAQDWSERGTGGSLTIDGRNIVDVYGRICNLRGVNMSGSSKMFVTFIIFIEYCPNLQIDQLTMTTRNFLATMRRLLLLVGHSLLNRVMNISHV